MAAARLMPRFVRPWHWIAAVTARLCWFLFFHDIHAGVPKGMRDGEFILDTHSYLASIESLIAGNGYDPDLRMPGYGAPYLLLRLLMDRDAAITGMIALNVVLGILSSVLLAALTWRLSRDRRIANAVFLITIAVPFVAEYDHHLLTESLAASTLIFSIHMLVRWRDEQRTVALLASGAWFCWAAFLRPVSGALLPIAIAAIWYTTTARGLRRAQAILLFALPFMLAEAAWIARNWRVHHAFHPLTNGMWEKSFTENPAYPIMRFVIAYGGYYVFWDPQGDINWFMDRPDGRDGTIEPAASDDQRVPDAIMCAAFDRDSLELIARDYHRMAYGAVPPIERDSLRRAMTERADRYRAAFERERPWQYHVAGRFRALRRFILHSGTEGVFRRPFGSSGLPAMLLKVLYAMVFVGSLVIGACWSAWRLIRGPDAFARLVPTMVLIGILTYPVVFRLIEYRYIVATWPLALMMACIGSARLLDLVRQRYSPDRHRRGAA